MTNLRCEDIAHGALGGHVKQMGQELLWRCPNHDDHDPSLKVNPHKDCWICGPCGVSGNVWELAAFLARVDPKDKAAVTAWLRDHGLLAGKASPQDEPTAVYSYHDADGKLLYEILRYGNGPNKTFRARRPHGKGGWVWNLKGVPRVVYRLPEVLKAERVFVVEGEKDAERLRSLGLTATTNPGGAGKWRAEFNPLFRGKEVVILPDNDKAGGQHTEDVARNLHPTAASVKVVSLPDLPEKGDVSDWFAAGHTKEELLALVEKAPAWSPSTSQADAASDEAQCAGASGSSGTASGRTQASTLLNLAESLITQGALLLFHNEFREPFASVQIAGHFENLPVRSRVFHEYLAELNFRKAGIVCNQQAMGAVKDILAARAVFDGPEHRLHNRVAWHEGAIWYDLSDHAWRAVRITREGWKVEDNPPILFRRFAHQRPQVEPTRTGNLDIALAFFNLHDQAAKRLLATTVVSFFVPDIPHPIPALYGEHGSAKTTLSKFIRAWVDPSETGTLGEPDRDEIIQALAHNYLLPLDNLRAVDSWLSDVLCRAVTGEGFSKRKLYTDEEDIIFAFRRCVLINGINSLPRRPDLMDRSILFGLEPIPEEKRREEVEVAASFQTALPSLLGATFNVLSNAIAVREELSLPVAPRMADFARWGAAISQAAGWTAKRFIVTYRREATARNEVAIEASPVAQAIRVFAERQNPQWQGTAGELLGELTKIAAELTIDTRAREWPKQPNVLSRRLNEVVPNLRAVGIWVTHGWKGSSKKIIVGTFGTEGSVANTSTSESMETDDTDYTDDFSPAPAQSTKAGANKSDNGECQGGQAPSSGDGAKAADATMGSKVREAL